jgi:hypothetical protein
MKKSEAKLLILSKSSSSPSHEKMGQAFHPELASGKWHLLSLAEQLGHVGSEVSRALRRQEKKDRLYEGAVSRAFELLDLTLKDPRWRHRLKELARAREALADAVSGGHLYGSQMKDLDRYFFYFAVASRCHR